MMYFCKIALLLLLTISAAAQTEFEPNNTILQNSGSNTFTAPVTISANITASSPDDRDFFRIDLPYCAAWSFNIINPTGKPAVLRMYLYNGQNLSNVIVSSAGIAFDFNSGLPNPVVLNCGQTIYVQIDQTSGADLGAYSLQVTEKTFAGFVCNNTAASASLIPVDTTIQAKLNGYTCGGSVDEDWYRINAASCGVLNIKISDVNIAQEIKIEMYDSNQRLLGASANVAGGENSTLSVLVSGGVSYIKIYDRSGFNCGNQCTDPYDLTDDPFNVALTFDVTDAGECNNRIEEAFSIPVNTSFNAKLWGTNSLVSDNSNLPNTDFDGDQDWYKVTAPGCGVLNINVTGINMLQEVKIEMYDSNQKLIGVSANAGGGENSSLSVLVSGGVSYIRIYDRSGFNCGNQCTDPYDLADDPFNVALTFDVTDAGECNNRIEEAFSIPVNTSFNAKLWGSNYLVSDNSNLPNIDFDGDQDWYKVTAPGCGVLNINITGVNTLQEIQIEMYDSNQKLIAVSANVAGGANSTLSVIVSGGVSYIRIYDRSGFNCGNQCTDPYDLADDPFSVALTFDVTDACECNNRIEDACSIPINTSFDAKLWGINYLVSDNSSLPNTDFEGDQDWYKVTAPGCGVLNINVTGVNALQEIKIELYDSNQKLILASANVAGGANSTISVLVSSGVSYIRIYDRSGFNCGNQCSDLYDLADDPFNVALSYSPSTFNSLPLTAVLRSNSFCFDGVWKNFYNPANTNNILASINDNNLSLGDILVDDYVDNSAGLVGTDRFMRRHYVIASSIPASGTKRIRLYYTNADFANLQAATPGLTSAAQLVVTSYRGPNENGIYDPANGTTTFIPSSAITTGSLYGQNFLEFDVLELGEFWIHTGNFTLPLEYVSFSARLKNNQVELIWTTANEVNLKHFEIERSINGRDFSVIGTKAAGNHANNSYAHLDMGIHLLSSKVLYYRIRQIDLDGLFSFSSVAKLDFNKKPDISIFPNPAKNVITIVAPDVTTIQLLNITGQVIKGWKPNSRQQYDISGVPNGIYILKCSSPGMIQTEKVVIERY